MIRSNHDMKCCICGIDYEFDYKKEEPLPPHFPFCSKRCKAIDLGKWLNDEYHISTPITETDNLMDIESGTFDENEEALLAKTLDKDTNRV